VVTDDFLQLQMNGRSSEYAWSSFGKLLVTWAQVTLMVPHMFCLSYRRFHLPFLRLLHTIFLPTLECSSV